LETPTANLAARHIFPSYRFPESADLALSRAVQYAAYRSHPPGKILWYDNVDAAAARQKVQAVLREKAASKELT
jgi:hypothetical protein